MVNTLLVFTSLYLPLFAAAWILPQHRFGLKSRSRRVIRRADNGLFPADGMLVYGQATLPDGRVVVSSESLALEISRRKTASVLQDDVGAGVSAATTEEPELEGLELRPRTVSVGSALNLTVFEIAHPQEMLEEWMMRDAVVHEGSPSAEKAEVALPPVSLGSSDLDPFGVVLWPGAQLLAARLIGESEFGDNDDVELLPVFGRARLAGRRVLCLGAGTGLEALAAASMGAHVMATDTNPLPLALLRKASQVAAAAAAAAAVHSTANATAAAAATGGVGAVGGGFGSLQTAYFDILDPGAPAPSWAHAQKSREKSEFRREGSEGVDEAAGISDFLAAEGWDLLLSCDLLVAADCIYNAPLAAALAGCCLAAWTGDKKQGSEGLPLRVGVGASVLVADSQGFHKADFLNALKDGWPAVALSPTPATGVSLLNPPELIPVAMKNVSGSGLLIEGDLNYNITVHTLYLPGTMHLAA